MNKDKYLETVINECINESIEEYKNFDGTFDEFKQRYPIHYQSDRGKGIGGRVYLYAIAPQAAIPSIFKNGQDIEFSGSGEGTNWYGAGFYGTWDYEAAYSNLKNGKGGCYGNTIVKYVLKDGFKDFIIFDADLRAQYGITESPSEQMRELMSDEDYNSYDEHLRHSDYINSDDQQLGIKFIDKPAKELKAYRGGRYGAGHGGFNPAKNFWEFFKGNRLRDENGSEMKIWQEYALRNSKVRGFAFDGGQDPHTVVVKNFKDVMPVGFVQNPTADNEKQVTWDTRYATEEAFNNINSSEDINWRYGGKYKKTRHDEKAIFDYARVRDNGGYNYVSLKDDSELLPYPAEEAIQFGPDKRATFTIDGLEHQARIMPNGEAKLFWRGSGFPLSREMFARKVESERNKG